MNKSFILIISLIISLLWFTSAPARIVCWTNKDGFRECGDRVPPEYAQQEHQELSRHGIVVEETEAAKSEEELDELKRLARERAEKRRLEEEQERRDRMLLDTFSSVDDIKMARDGRISAIETTIGLAERRIDKLREDKNELVKKAAARERAGKELPEYLIRDMEAIDDQIAANNKFIADKRKEQQEVRERHNKDIERYEQIRLLRR